MFWYLFYNRWGSDVTGAPGGLTVIAALTQHIYTSIPSSFFTISSLHPYPSSPSAVSVFYFVRVVTCDNLDWHSIRPRRQCTCLPRLPPVVHSWYPWSRLHPVQVLHVYVGWLLPIRRRVLHPLLRLGPWGYIRFRHRQKLREHRGFWNHCLRCSDLRGQYLRRHQHELVSCFRLWRMDIPYSWRP